MTERAREVKESVYNTEGEARKMNGCAGVKRREGDEENYSK